MGQRYSRAPTKVTSLTGCPLPGPPCAAGGAETGWRPPGCGRMAVVTAMVSREQQPGMTAVAGRPGAAGVPGRLSVTDGISAAGVAGGRNMADGASAAGMPDGPGVADRLG